MNIFTNISNKIRHFLKTHDFTWGEIAIIVASLLFFLVNATYVLYPDEFVNILAGKAILAGKLPYKDFFDHHLPFAWYLASFLLLFSFKSYIIFRYLFAIFVFVLLLLTGCWIKKRHNSFYLYYLIFLFAYPLMAVYFWFHLYLADSLAVLFFSITFWILMVQTLDQKVSQKAIIMASLSTIAMLFSSLTFLYMALVLYAWQFYLVFIYKKNILSYIGAVIAPYLLYGLFLFVTGSINDFYFANFYYNTNLYISIPNYVKGHFFNPIKFAFTLIFNFYTNYLPLLSRIRFLDLYLPIGVLSGLATLLLLLLLSWRNVLIGIFFFFILSFSAPRSNISQYKETDYQGSLFLVLGLISTLLVLYILRKTKFVEELANDVKRLSQLLLSIFLLFSLIFLLANTYNKFFLRYTQQMPSIQSFSYKAQFIDSLVNEGEYYWVGPYEPHEEFFVQKGKIPGKYPTLLPQFRENDYLKQSFIAQFDMNRPKIIIFEHEASIFGTPAIEFGKFFLDWMADKYTSVENIPGGVTALKSPSDMSLRTDLYIRNDKISEVLQSLRNEGYIE